MKLRSAINLARSGNGNWAASQSSYYYTKTIPGGRARLPILKDGQKPPSQHLKWGYWGDLTPLEETKLSENDWKHINSVQESYFTVDQFYDLYRSSSKSEGCLTGSGKRELCGEEKLLLAVLENAFYVLKYGWRGRLSNGSGNAISVPSAREVWETWRWFLRDEPHVLTSFSNICAMFGLPQEAIREKLFDES